MSAFPRTTVGGLSLSRMIIGTNWFLGFSHTSAAKDAYIKEQVAKPEWIASILEVFYRAGVDTIMGMVETPPLLEALKIAEDRTGVKAIVIATPHLLVNPLTPSQGFDMGVVERIVAHQAESGAAFCMPHQCTTDAMVDRCTREIRQMAPVCKMIRDYGMRPGLSTHMPESIIYADETNLDVDSYIQLYNSMGFLMQVEVDWIASVIRNAHKPVMTIKPMAAGQLRPFQALNFVWNTIRPQDMVTVGTLSPGEAQELIDISMQILAGQEVNIKLQETRSKASLKARA